MDIPTLHEVELVKKIAAEQKLRKVKSKFTAAKIEEITTHALKHTRKQTKQWWDKSHADREISVPTIDKYVKHFSTSKKYFAPNGSGGAAQLLNVEELKTLLKVFDYWRSRGLRVRPVQAAGECH